MGDKSNTGNREATASPETEVAGTEAERTDFYSYSFPFQSHISTVLSKISIAWAS